MRTIIASDFDGTLTSRDTLVEFIRFAKGNVRCFLGFLIYSPLIMLLMLRLYPNYKSKQKLFSYFFRGMSIDEFNRLGVEFAASNRHLLRPGGQEMIRNAWLACFLYLLVKRLLKNKIRRERHALSVLFLLYF